jgi:SAM-dependent methyltransferase
MMINILKRICSTRNFNLGYCPICQKKTIFVETGVWLRDYYYCVRCKSIPRWRALIYILNEHFPNWRDLTIHESSPGGPSSEKLKKECKSYTLSQFFPDTAAGTSKEGVRCENLEALTFQDGTFDVFVTQDVLEHVLNPEKVLGEIARVLKPGGAHVFTVPWYYWQPTKIRAATIDGAIKYFHPPEYHGNPVDANGSLVVTEWGVDFIDFIQTASSLTTTAIRIHDKKFGIAGKFADVFISRKKI